jgi:hypothetical protein
VAKWLGVYVGSSNYAALFSFQTLLWALLARIIKASLHYYLHRLIYLFFFLKNQINNHKGEIKGAKIIL